MNRTRLEYLADRLEVLDAEIRNHESEARWHEHMATQKRKQLEGVYHETVAETRMMEITPGYYENATNQVALPAYTFDNISTAIVADIRSAR